ncbi:MAG: helix-turn-helix transcriptional regulator [Legionellales bacterium]|nr:helix-turn-helix transcriptional regulator [Legionellales bacterium]
MKINQPIMNKVIPTSPQVLIAELLSLRQYSMSRLANELCISKASISRLMNGSIKQPHNATYQKLLSLYCSVFCNNPSITQALEHEH